jgi:polyisoprenyl-phosphate glycosyltransferase
MLNAQFIMNSTIPVTHRRQVLFVVPVFNDWQSLEILLQSLDQSMQDLGIAGKVLVVDDASTERSPSFNLGLQSIHQVAILKLKRNLGHQRAITIGLAYAEVHCTADIVVVMDGDGEDTPEEAMRLIQTCEQYSDEKIIFARRTQRTERASFKLFYRIYRIIYRLLTGSDIHVGNFSAIPFALLPCLVGVSEIWNHYAAGILKAKLPHVNLSTCRGYRYRGRSTMNFISLVMHGLSAISVYGEVVGVRLLMVSCGLTGCTLITLVVTIGIRVLTSLAIPGWTSYLVISLVSIVLQTLIMSLCFIFFVLAGRNNASFIPSRDYSHFIRSIDEVFCLI